MTGLNYIKMPRNVTEYTLMKGVTDFSNLKQFDLFESGYSFLTVVSVPRFMQLLAAQGIITLKEDAGLAATKNDVVDNPHNIELVEMEAAQLPRTLSDVDFAVINGNYAAEAGFSASKDALAVEDATSEAAQTYANLLVVEEGNENEPAIKALVAALTSQTVKDYIDSTYDGAVVAIF